MMYKDFADRITELREQKGLTERELSIALGEAPEFMYKIENRDQLLLVADFFEICSRLEITPQEFFDYENFSLSATDELIKNIRKLDYRQTNIVLEVVKSMNKE